LSLEFLRLEELNSKVLQLIDAELNGALFINQIQFRPISYWNIRLQFRVSKFRKHVSRSFRNFWPTDFLYPARILFFVKGFSSIDRNKKKLFKFYFSIVPFCDHFTKYIKIQLKNNFRCEKQRHYT